MDAGRKKPKTLSGIETAALPLLLRKLRRKKPKTLSGIETANLPPETFFLPPRRKKPKTLSGIETHGKRRSGSSWIAGKNLKPYQGLKPKHFHCINCCRAGKNLKPYQGLKRISALIDFTSPLPEKT